MLVMLLGLALVAQLALAGGRDFYKILGVPRSANEKQIKKAYRKKALEWHPDKHVDNQEEANDRFSEINNAYEVLSDPAKRREYDQVGEDGMGGAQAGEYASAMATREVSQLVNDRFKRLEARSEELNIPDILEEAIKKANKSIYDAAKRNPQLQGMGTTITAGVVYQGMLYIGHVGDSRGYLITKTEIEKITRDHSLVGRLLEIGQITEEEAAVHPQRNLIYRSLGAYPNVEVDLYERPFVPGACLLLCSDGLVEHVKDPEIHKVVTQAPDQWRACNQLVNSANIRGGEDNTTLIIVYMDDLR